MQKVQDEFVLSICLELSEIRQESKIEDTEKLHNRVKEFTEVGYIIVDTSSVISNNNTVVLFVSLRLFKED